MPFSTPVNKKVLTVVFDTAVSDFNGVANTTIAAHPQFAVLPSGAIITDVFYVVNTTFTSATDAGTIALSIEGANDLKTAIAISDASNVYDAGVRGCLPLAYAERTVAGDTAVLDSASRAAALVKTTASRKVTATVAVEVLTAGKLTLYIEYFLPV